MGQPQQQQQQQGSPLLAQQLAGKKSDNPVFFSALAPKLGDFFSRKLKKLANRAGANSDQKLKYQPKNGHFGRKTGKFSGNSRIFAKLTKKPH